MAGLGLCSSHRVAAPPLKNGNVLEAVIPLSPARLVVKWSASPSLWLHSRSNGNDAPHELSGPTLFCLSMSHISRVTHNSFLVVNWCHTEQHYIVYVWRLDAPATRVFGAQTIRAVLALSESCFVVSCVSAQGLPILLVLRHSRVLHQLACDAEVVDMAALGDSSFVYVDQLVVYTAPPCVPVLRLPSPATCIRACNASSFAVVCGHEVIVWCRGVVTHRLKQRGARVVCWVNSSTLAIGCTFNVKVWDIGETSSGPRCVGTMHLRRRVIDVAHMAHGVLAVVDEGGVHECVLRCEDHGYTCEDCGRRLRALRNAAAAMALRRKGIPRDVIEHILSF